MSGHVISHQFLHSAATLCDSGAQLVSVQSRISGTCCHCCDTELARYEYELSLLGCNTTHYQQHYHSVNQSVTVRPAA